MSGVTACARPGCGGTIEADGYCSDCFFPPEAPDVDLAKSAGPARVSVPIPRARPDSGSTRASAASSSRRRIGGGMVELPPVPVRDPAAAVLKNPQVEEEQRFCGRCEHPVGRRRAGKLGVTEGFCPKCGTPFCFTPKLEPGEIVSGQYQVVGCIAHGGQGWVYLATDLHLDARPVVLKGLLNTGDQAVQLSERRFLATVKHPNIVGVHNFVEHTDRRTHTAAGYIVMEYVGGQSLKHLMLEQRQVGRSMPVAHALAYSVEILSALGYMHDKGLVYCDFKPDNAVLAEDQLKLIDMGAVRRADDDAGDVYSTIGYRAPEISEGGPSPSAASDLYTVGRSLAVLTFEFAGFTKDYAHRLPDQATVRVLAEHESFYRLLLRATDPDPRRRFTSAQEMARQVTGVLREVLSMADGVPRPSFSALFSPEPQAIGASSAGVAADIVAGLPVPLPDSADPAATYLATLGALDPPGQAAELAAVTAGRPGTPPGVADSVEVRLALARARVMSGELDAAAADLASLIDTGRADWRVTWYQGLGDLAAGRPGPARAAFEAVYDTLPGELAPRLAVGLCAELAGDPAAAARHLLAVWTVDRSYVGAAFGLARIRLAVGDADGAIAVLTAVPEAASQYVAAQTAALRARISGRDPSRLSLADLTEAASQLRRLPLEAAATVQLEAEILRAALGWLAAVSGPAGPATAGPDTARLLDRDLTEQSLRLGLEQAYRSLARLAPQRSERVRLVNLANDVRPRTRF